MADSDLEVTSDPSQKLESIPQSKSLIPSYQNLQLNLFERYRSMRILNCLLHSNSKPQWNI